MPEQPLISVMILTYNHQDYIRQSIEGALMQQCDYPFEIVISDDCSTDNTREICLEYQKQYPDKIKLIFNKENKGVIENYFGTMRECQGKYIADCSGDDYWIDATKLQKQVDILEEKEDIILVHTNWKDLFSSSGKILNDAKGRKENTKSIIFSHKDLPLYLNQKGYSLVNINTSCYRKDKTLEIYEANKYLFDNKLYPCEDYQLLFLLLANGDFYYIDEDMAVYRNQEDSISQSKNLKKKLNFEFKITQLKIRLSKDYQIPLTQYLNKQAPYLLLSCIKTKQKKLAKEVKILLNDFDYNLSVKEQILYIFASSKILTTMCYPAYLLLRKNRS